jgi:hypothetical protein
VLGVRKSLNANQEEILDSDLDSDPFKRDQNENVNANNAYSK